MPNFVDSIEEAARLISSASRIMVIGSSGAGKSTLSRKLADRFGLEYQSIDKDVRFLSGWAQRDKAEQRAILEGLVVRDLWVMDGSNPSTFDLRLPLTDIVIWVRMPRWLCLLGVAQRVFRSYGTVRSESAAGCPELPNREFLSYIWNFEKETTPIFLRNFDRYAPNLPVFQLKSRAETQHLLDLLGAGH